jgi:hypothetical protein
MTRINQFLIFMKRSPSNEPNSPYPDMGLFNCALLNPSEKENLKVVNCKTTAI